MKKRTKNSRLFLFIIVFCGLILVNCNTIDPVEFGNGDDYDIYELIINEKIASDNILVVLQDSTYAEEFIQHNPDHYFRHFPDADQSTLDNYIHTNQNKIKLKSILGINFVFRSSYDNTAENDVDVNLSRVGYNDSKTEAFVSIGALYGPLAGSGSLILLNKINNEWQIVKSIMTWIS